MSLRVWLPLNGSLINQGLDKITVANSGATINNSGKIGKCYSFDGSDDRVYANNISLSNSAMSACCWVKLNSITNNNYPYIFALGSNTSGTGIQIGLSVWKSDSKLHLVGNGSEPSSGYTPPLNTWIHLCITISGASTKLYVNGVLTNTQTNANSPKTQNCLCIGARSNSTSGAGVSFSYPLNGYINDFRLYDHALSQQEIKKLSQGLILHYPLETGNLINYDTITHGYYLNSAGNESGDNGWCHTDYIRIMPNSSYVGIGLSAGGSNTYAVLYNSSKTKTRTVLLVANQNLSIITTENEYFIRLSIRKYVNELTTTSKFLQLNNIVKDISGYQNNGTITGTVIHNIDTSKYHVSTEFDGTNYIIADSPSTEGKTLSAWVKTTSTSNRALVIDYKSGLGIGFWSNYFIPSCNASITTTYSFTDYVVNQWNHIVITKPSSSSVLCYINGKLQDTTSRTDRWSTGVIDKLSIACRPNGNSPIACMVSDVRIYSTALSADDVKELYEYNIMN